MNNEKTVVNGYLPDESPNFWKLILFAFQQIIVMFPATVLVAILTGFNVSTTIFASGLATLCFILITGKKIPLYYGSSFSYIAAICSITTTQAWTNGVAPDSLIGQAQFGIILSGLVSIAAGLIVKRFKMEAIEKVLPPTVTGSIAIVIGLSLAGSAMTNPINVATIPGVVAENLALAKNLGWAIALVTLLSTILFSVYLKKGTWSQIPILLGLLVGYVVALILGLIFDMKFVNFGLAEGSKIFALPHFTFPKASWGAVAAIMPIAIATIPESTAHLYQLDIYVNDLAKKKNSKLYKIADKLGLNLIGDGLGDMISGAVGGPAGTNYGENLSTMSITKNFSVNVLIAAAIITMFISFFTPLSAAVYSIPSAVIGGISIYLFGVIGAQGIAIMIDKKVDLFNAKNLAVISTILIIGIGGSFAPFGGMIDIFGFKAPAIASAAIFGIVLNLIFTITDKISNKNKTVAQEEVAEEEIKAETVAEIKAEAVAEVKAEAAISEIKAEPIAEIKVEEPVADTKTETVAEEAKVDEQPKQAAAKKPRKPAAKKPE
jgi:uracil permease